VPTQVIVPVKSFRLGKQRLAGTLSDPEREQLARDLADHVVRVATKTGLTPIIVTSDDEVAAWAQSSLLESIRDPGTGLNAAASTGSRWAERAGSSWLVVHSDLPLLAPDDLDALTSALDDQGAVLAPSSDGGTSAIGASGDFVFSFGIGSFHRHLARLHGPRVVARRGLLLDVDSPRDLIAATGKT
jgi:2-phospho-L-lactate guanylyltransferase